MFNKKISLQIEWNELCNGEKVYKRQKYREFWFKEGDKNTKFFHALVKHKKVASVISYIRCSNSSCLIEDAHDIQKEGVKFFKNLLIPPNLDSNSDIAANHLLASISRLVSDGDNKLLLAPFTLEEIHKVVFSFPPEKALDPNGFTAYFFQRCWDVICVDLLAAMEESAHLLKR